MLSHTLAGPALRYRFYSVITFRKYSSTTSILRYTLFGEAPCRNRTNFAD
jgi:hypothetical protein